jgi:hypothetical protein
MALIVHEVCAFVVAVAELDETAVHEPELVLVAYILAKPLRDDLEHVLDKCSF